MVRDITVDWNPASQAAVVTLATAEELPAEVEEYVAETSSPLSEIRSVIHKRGSYLVVKISATTRKRRRHYCTKRLVIMRSAHRFSLLEKTAKCA